MKRKILALTIVIAALAFAGCRLDKERETWLRIEESGIYYEADYLHRLAELKPYKAREYLGSCISFAAALDRTVQKEELPAYGSEDALMYFVLPGGRSFVVDCSGLENTAEYSKGDRLLVKGRISGINRNCIYILNLYGSPGYPNCISVEKLQ